ncbi:hypothetical protein [Terrilactibacillus tamarindi]|uniref:hypothetical protein n=1 Tax=Terrilactibacillus tamarindi TaxID=2599694 RepID=UPI0018AD1FDD|nr:hypothetical protein [Terrilactibacillus tamarindi]
MRVQKGDKLEARRSRRRRFEDRNVGFYYMRTGFPQDVVASTLLTGRERFYLKILLEGAEIRSLSFGNFLNNLYKVNA